MKTSFIASGDSFITRRIPAGSESVKELAAFIREHDVAFNNLEITCHDCEGYPAAFSGGTWAMAEPAVLDDLNALGFNLYNTANNHCCDYGIEGLMATIRHMKERGMVFAGTGKNMAAASAPCYFEAPGCRVAMLGVSSDFHDSDIAGEQGPDLPGRPGLSTLRVKTTYHVTKEYFESLQAVVRATNMNSYEEYGVKLGYVLPKPEGLLSMGGMSFKLDDINRTETQPHPADMKRILNEIAEARRQADYVIVSVHTHAGHPDDYIKAPEFLEAFAHACVDAGADMILGHGPHELRGIEIYKGKPVFYSIGNFIFETETVGLQPAEAYLGKNFPVETKVGEYMSARSKNGTRGYGIMEPVWFSVLPEWEVEDGAVKEIRLYPITLDRTRSRAQKGFPRLVKDDSILAYLQGLCEPYGTAIAIEDGVGIIRL